VRLGHTPVAANGWHTSVCLLTHASPVAQKPRTNPWHTGASGLTFTCRYGHADAVHTPCRRRGEGVRPVGSQPKGIIKEVPSAQAAIDIVFKLSTVTASPVATGGCLMAREFPPPVDSTLYARARDDMQRAHLQEVGAHGHLGGLDFVREVARGARAAAAQPARAHRHLG
jgi:hypothetical protein